MSTNNGRISQRESWRSTTMSSYLGRRTVTAAASPCCVVFLLLLVVLTATFVPVDEATGRCRIFASATTAPFGMVGKNRSVVRTGMQAVVPSSIAVRGGGGAADVVATPTTTTCCWIASQSLPKTVREGILKQVESAASLTIIQPANCWEAANLVESSPPVILFRPDAADLQRGEGLWTMLGPVMERVIATKKNGAAPALCVMAPATMSIADVQAKLEEGAMKLLPFLSTTTNQPRNIVTLKDVFANVQYVTTPQEAIAACTEMGRATSVAVATVSSSSSSSAATAMLKMSNNKLIQPPMTPANLAAARRLGVDARRQVDETMEKIRRACTTDNGEVKMVANFGELCRASLRQAKLKGAAAAPVDGSDVAKQMQSYVKSSLEHSLADLYDQQVALLEEACFEEFRGKLSTLKISPNLPADMAKLAHDAVTKFAKAASRMAPPAAGGVLSSSLATIRPAATAVAASTSTTMMMTPGTAAFRRRLNDYVAARLLKATATNKFRPLPRKGVTVGLHWLFPKPFGNDYRQEPWKVHATDNMVYVPGALSDVNPDQVADGSWRDAIVPLPSGKDMLYMQ
jgi:hypothetical protein